MRILILHSQYLSGPASGENRVVEDECRLLEGAGHEVRSLTPTPEAEGKVSSLRVAGEAIWSRRWANEVARVISEFRPDVAHCHNLWPVLSPAIIRVLERMNVPTVMTLHNYRLMCLPGTFLLDGAICERCLGSSTLSGVRYRCYRDSVAASGVLATSIQLHRAVHSFDGIDRFLAVSAFVKAKYVQAGFAPDRVSIKPNFSWPMTIRRGAGDYCLYLGRLAHEKGVDTLLEAFRGRTEELVVVGDGPEAERLRSSAPPNVHFRGLLRPDEIDDVLSRASAVLVPSIWYEPAPRSVVEAFAAGIPVVASRIGGLPELVRDGESGFLVGPGDSAAWAAAVDRLGRPGEAERLGEGAWRLWDEYYRPERALENLESEYAAVVAAASSGTPG
jgi:glycosyltransferase involved in cell wall biosynthesis